MVSFLFKAQVRVRKRLQRVMTDGDSRQWRLRLMTALVLFCGLLADAGAQEAPSGALPGGREFFPVEASEPPSPSAPADQEGGRPSGTDPHAVSQETGTTSGPSAPDGTTGTAPQAPSPQPPAGPPGNEDFIEGVHDSISQGFLGSAMWLDSFFGDERYEAEVNRSQLKIRFEAFREGDTGMDYRRPNFDLRLVLPQLRKKTRLVVSGDPTVDYDATATPPTTAAGQLPPPGGTSTVTTALQYFPVETKRSNLSLRAGLKLSNGKLQLLLGPRYRYLVHFVHWDLRFTQEVIWTSDVGWQALTRFDYERPLSDGLFFRTSLEGRWAETVNGYPYDLRFLLRHPLDPNRAVEYEWISSFQTRPTDMLTEELLVFRYRQRFWKEWLFLEIDPQIRYPRDRNFAFTPGILFRLELVFGQYGSLF